MPITIDFFIAVLGTIVTLLTFSIFSFVVVAIVFYLVNIAIGFVKFPASPEKYIYSVDENGNETVQDTRDVK